MFLSYILSSRGQRILLIRFIFSGTLWFFPLLAWIILLEWTLWQVGETKPVIQVARLLDDENGNSRFMRKYIDQALYRFKYVVMQSKNPPIVVLGTSRVMQIRAQMIGLPPEVFFNAGGMIQHLKDLEEFVENLTVDRVPRVIILGVEMWWFNERWADFHEKQKHYTVERKKDDAVDGFAHARLYQLSLQSTLFGGGSADLALGSIIKRLYRESSATDRNHYGLLAFEKGAGFRKDGSFDYNVVEPDRDNNWIFQDRESPTIAERIRLGIAGFESATGLSNDLLERFRSILKMFHEKGVIVICFTPPYASSVSALLDQSPSQATLWHEFLELIPKVVREEGAYCFVFRSPLDFGLDDRYMLDGLHGMETLHAYIGRRFLHNSMCLDALGGDPAIVDLLLAGNNVTPWHVIAQ